MTKEKRRILAPIAFASNFLKKTDVGKIMLVKTPRTIAEAWGVNFPGSDKEVDALINVETGHTSGFEVTEEVIEVVSITDEDQRRCDDIVNKLAQITFEETLGSTAKSFMEGKYSEFLEHFKNKENEE